MRRAATKSDRPKPHPSQKSVRIDYDVWQIVKRRSTQQRCEMGQVIRELVNGGLIYEHAQPLGQVANMIAAELERTKEKS